MDPHSAKSPRTTTHDQHIDGRFIAGLLGGVQQPPGLSRRLGAYECVAAEVERRSHHPPKHSRLRATNQKNAGKGGVQSAGANPVRQSVLADSGRPQLAQVNMTVLPFGKTSHFGITTRSSQLK